MFAAPALAACTTEETASDAAATPAAEAGALPSAHVHGVAFAPGDDTFLLATHDGLLEVGADGRHTPIGPGIDLMGFAVTGNRYLASGHPGPGVDLPEPVGLIESTDGGRSWEVLSRSGQSDFHALTAGDAGILGWDGTLVRSEDGRAWEQLTIPDEPAALAAAPTGSTVLATTGRGLLRSADGGATWTDVPDAPLLQVVDWAEDGATVAGVDPAGTVWLSPDAGGTWERGERLGSPPGAVTVTTAGGGPPRVAVVTGDGLWDSTDGGRSFTAVQVR
ncbi:MULTISPECIES: F510_1955 family glycosylhydrolase [unclassified Modestobacter]